MDWFGLLPLVFLAAAYVSTLYQAWRDDWGFNQKAGAALFLLGVTAALLLDDFLAPESSLLPWIEPVSAVVMIIGFYFHWFRRAADDTSEAINQV